MSEKKEYRESRLRSILKTISWRIIATTTTFCLTLLVFHDDKNAIEKSSIAAGLELVIKLGLYYLHERGWQMVPRGQIRKITHLK